MQISVCSATVVNMPAQAIGREARLARRRMLAAQRKLDRL